MIYKPNYLSNKSIKIYKSFIYPLHKLFSNSKIQQLLKQLNTCKTQHTISTLASHEKLMQFIQLDTNSQLERYKYYSSVRGLYKAYVDQIINSKTKINTNNNGKNTNNQNIQQFGKYDPNAIRIQGQKLSQLANKLSKYPLFDIQPKIINDSYRIFCRMINCRNDDQMNKMLLLSLKADKKVEQSVLYGEYLKFYLGENWQYIKSKFQLDLRKQNIGQGMKKIFAGLIHRGFFKRTPSYTRSLSILYTTQTLQYILQNSSTTNSLLISKLMYQQIFTPIVNQYQQNLHSNLYHRQNVKLWNYLNKNCLIIFNANKLIEKQNSYLRQLYITLFLVLKQQQKFNQIEEYICEIGTVYGFVKQNYDSPKAKQFLNAVEQFIQGLVNIQQKTFKNIGINQHVFNLITNFPSLKNSLFKQISQKLTPLLFYTYFDKIKAILPFWNKQIITKITAVQSQNYFNLLSFADSLNLITLIKSQNQQKNITFANDIPYKIYHRLIQSIVHKDYPNQPSLEQIIIILQIYSKQNQFNHNQSVQQKQKQKQKQNIKMLRVFLFRFISDNKTKFTRKQLQRIIQFIVNLDDTEKFGDGEGNYQLNIFQQLEATVNRSFINQGLKQKFYSKIQKNDKNQSKSSQIFDILKKIQNKH